MKVRRNRLCTEGFEYGVESVGALIADVVPLLKSMQCDDVHKEGIHISTARTSTCRSSSERFCSMLLAT